MELLTNVVIFIIHDNRYWNYYPMLFFCYYQSNVGIYRISVSNMGITIQCWYFQNIQYGTIEYPIMVITQYCMLVFIEYQFGNY